MNEQSSDRLERLNGRISLWFARFAALILSIIGVMTFCDVIARYFFNRPFTFTVEFTEILMGMVIFLGIGLTTHENRHISVDVVTMRLRSRVRAILEIVMSLAGFAMLSVMVWQMWLNASHMYSTGQYTQIHKLIYWPFAYVMAVASVLFLTGFLLYALRALRRLRDSHEA